MRDIFRMYDADGDGALTVDELVAAMTGQQPAKGVGGAPGSRERLGAGAGSGAAEGEKGAGAAAPPVAGAATRVGLTEGELRRLFQLIDADSSQTIDFGEFRSMMRELLCLDLTAELMKLSRMRARQAPARSHHAPHLVARGHAHRTAPHRTSHRTTPHAGTSPCRWRRRRRRRARRRQRASSRRGTARSGWRGRRGRGALGAEVCMRGAPVVVVARGRHGDTRAARTCGVGWRTQRTARHGQQGSLPAAQSGG